MTDFDKLPAERGLYRIETVSGTVHILSIEGRTVWERRPAPGAGRAAYDGHSVILSELGAGLGSTPPGLPGGLRRELPRRKDHSSDCHDHQHHPGRPAVTEVVDCANPLLEALTPNIETLHSDRTRAAFPTVEAVAAVAAVAAVTVGKPAHIPDHGSTDRPLLHRPRVRNPALRQLAGGLPIAPWAQNSRAQTRCCAHLSRDLPSRHRLAPAGNSGPAGEGNDTSGERRTRRSLAANTRRCTGTLPGGCVRVTIVKPEDLASGQSRATVVPPTPAVSVTRVTHGEFIRRRGPMQTPLDVDNPKSVGERW